MPEKPSHKNEKHTEAKTSHHEPSSDSWFSDTTIMYALTAVTVLILLNQWQYLQLATLMTGGGAMAGTGATLTLGSFQLDDYSVLGPAHMGILAGEKPVLPGYNSKIIKFQAISPHTIPGSTGDSVQDAINSLVSTGTPFYGAEAGVSFDDPVAALTTWAQWEGKIQLSAEQEARWNKIVGAFTCDFCCGSPQNPTIITRCGCQHAGAWRGIAKFFVKNYGDKYTDSQIMGEMTRWKVMWYPGPIIKRVFAEMGQAA